jgi:hypothetical protein
VARRPDLYNAGGQIGAASREKNRRSGIAEGARIGF